MKKALLFVCFLCVIITISACEQKPVSTNKDVEFINSEGKKNMTSSMEDPLAKKK